MLNKEDLEQIEKLFVANNALLDKKLDEKLRPLQQDISRLDDKFRPLQQDMARLERTIEGLDDKFRPLQQDMARLERSIEAIETLPVPNGRPKTFLSATEVHSVTGSRRTRYGYQG